MPAGATESRGRSVQRPAVIAATNDRKKLETMKFEDQRQSAAKVMAVTNRDSPARTQPRRFQVQIPFDLVQ